MVVSFYMLALQQAEDSLPEADGMDSHSLQDPTTG